MERVKCTNCNYKLDKPTLEILIYNVIKEGGSVFAKFCPKCKNTSLDISEVSDNESKERYQRSEIMHGDSD